MNDRWVGAARFTMEKPLFIAVGFFRNSNVKQFDFRFLDEKPVYYQESRR